MLQKCTPGEIDSTSGLCGGIERNGDYGRPWTFLHHEHLWRRCKTTKPWEGSQAENRPNHRFNVNRPIFWNFLIVVQVSLGVAAKRCL